MTSNALRLVCALIVLVFINACSQHYVKTGDSAPSYTPENIENTPNAIPRIEAKSRGGNPRSYEVFGKTYYVLESSQDFVERGIASWYGTKFHGNKTSNGETYDMYAMTAAHKSLPLPSYVEVKNLSNGKTIIVRVNDRGPFHSGRIIDLSYAAAAKLGTLKNGTSPVEIRAINLTNSPTKAITSVAIPRPQALTPPPALTPPSKKAIYIQLGAFKTRQNANRLKQQLSNEVAISSNIVTLEKNNDTLYLVHAGPYIDLSSAEPVHLKIQQMGIFNSHFIRR